MEFKSDNYDNASGKLFSCMYVSCMSGCPSFYSSTYFQLILHFRHHFLSLFTIDPIKYFFMRFVLSLRKSAKKTFMLLFISAEKLGNLVWSLRINNFEKIILKSIIHLCSYSHPFGLYFFIDVLTINLQRGT